MKCHKFVSYWSTCKTRFKGKAPSLKNEACDFAGGIRYIHMPLSLPVYQALARLLFPEGLLDDFTAVNIEERDVPEKGRSIIKSGKHASPGALTEGYFWDYR